MRIGTNGEPVSEIIRDDLGVLWRYSPEKKRVKAENDNDPFGGYHADSVDDAIVVLRELGYITK